MVDQQLKKQIQGELMEVARCQEVKPGPAVIRTAVSGEVKDYTVEIQKVDQSPSKRNKAMVLKVTDPELLSLTGGIVQGLSGTPHSSEWKTGRSCNTCVCPGSIKRLWNTGR